MKPLSVLVAVAVTALIFTTAALSAQSRWSSLTLDEKRAIVTATIQHDRSSVKWWITHRPQPDLFVKKLSLNQRFTLIPGLTLCPHLGIRAPTGVCNRAAELRHARVVLAQIEETIRLTIPETNDWQTAVRIMQRYYPGSEPWLIACSSSEGGHGGFVMNTQGSGAGGWMQFMEGTFWGDFNAASADLRSHGVIIPGSASSWQSPLGQAIAAGWAYGHNRPAGKWTGSRC